MEDEGGTWTAGADDGEPRHGLDIVSKISDDWGRDGDPVSGWVVWARFDWPTASHQLIEPYAAPEVSVASYRF